MISERIQVAILDDGVDASKLSSSCKVIQDWVVEANGTVRPRRTEDFYLAFHGTRCAAIIEAYARNVEFISLCIFDTAMLRTEGGKLIAALEWCLEQKVPVIHMSVGTQLLADYEALRRVTARLVKENQMIIAAGSNSGAFTMPACLNGVLGVAAERELTGKAYHFHFFGNGLSIGASASHLLSIGESTVQTSRANSYAAPTVTAAVCRILKEEGTEKRENCVGMFQKLLPGEAYHALHPDFVEDALVLNLSGKELCREQFFFSFREVVFCLEDGLFQKSVEGRNCLVIIPGEDRCQKEHVLAFVEQHPEAFDGILYGGREQKRLERLREKMLVWQEDDCGIAGWKGSRRKRREEGIPYVLIQTERREGVWLACELQRQFREMEYQCVAASNWEYAYLYGLEYIPPGAEPEQVKEYLEEVFVPDLVILLDRQGEDWGLGEDEVYKVREEEFAEKELYEKIVGYFS